MRRRALAVVVLLALAIVPVMAAPAVVTGSAITGFTTDFTTTGFYANPYVDIKATVSPWIATTVRLYYYMTYTTLNGVTGTSTVPVAPLTATTVLPMVYYAYSDINVTQPFGIDPKQFDLLLTAGYHSVGDNGYSNQTYSSGGDVSASAVGLDWILMGTAKVADMVWIKAAVAPRSYATPNYFFGAYMTPTMGAGQLKAELFYDSNSKAVGTPGVVSATAAYVLNLDKVSALTPAFGFKYDLSTPNTNAWAWQVSAKYATGTALTTGFNVAVGAWGNQLGPFTGVEATAYITPVVFNTGVSKDKDGKEVTDAQKFVSLDICSNVRALFYPTTADTLQGWDNALRINIGTADIYVGYAYTTAAAKYLAWGTNAYFAQGSATATFPVVAGGAYVRFVAPF